jgi:hypothetical protein
VSTSVATRPCSPSRSGRRAGSLLRSLPPCAPCAHSLFGIRSPLPAFGWTRANRSVRRDSAAGLGRAQCRTHDQARGLAACRLPLADCRCSSVSRTAGIRSARVTTPTTRELSSTITWRKLIDMSASTASTSSWPISIVRRRTTSSTVTISSPVFPPIPPHSVSESPKSLFFQDVVAGFEPEGEL